MGWDAWVSLGLVLGLVLMMMFTTLAPDMLLLGGVSLLLLLNILTPDEALAGMANEGMITVGVMYVIVTGLRDTGGMEYVVRRLLGRPKSAPAAQFRMMSMVAAISPFMNNTPLVAMFIPALEDWAKQIGVSASKLMIPLSYASILGGVCALIGTSTNLVVHGLMIRSGYPGMGMFELAWVGVPATVVGIAYIMLASRWLLPDRRPVLSQLSDVRQYTIEMIVQPGSPLVGKSIETAGLRHLPGMYLAEIDREGTILAAVSPEEPLQAGDRLLFVGVVDSVIDLQRIRGLEPATDQVFKLDAPRRERCLIEAVVSNSCPAVGQTIREARFRNMYNAVVIAVARDGERIDRKIGDIELQQGDTLLVEAHPSFVEQQRNALDFLLVRPLEDSAPMRHERAPIALAILIFMVLAATFEWLSMLKAALLASGLMLLTQCCSGRVVRKNVDWQVLLVIAASFGLGTALEKTGAASAVAGTLIDMAGGNPWLTLVVVYGVTMLFTELITNNAAAVLVFPIALAASHRLGVDFRPFAIAMTIAASAGFSTPIGYQTHMMVYGPGGYKYFDYVRIGVPLNLLIWAVASLLIPTLWPLTAISPGQ